MRVDNKIYWNLFQNLFTERTLLLECRQQTKKKTKTKPCLNQRVHYRKKRVGEGGQGMFEIVGTCVLSHVWLFASSWTVACQASLFMTFSRQEYWSGLLFSIPSVNLLSCNRSYQSSWSLSYCFLGRICWWCLRVSVSLSLELQAVYKVPTYSWIDQEFPSFCSEQSYFPQIP